MPDSFVIDFQHSRSPPAGDHVNACENSTAGGEGTSNRSSEKSRSVPRPARRYGRSMMAAVGVAAVTVVGCGGIEAHLGRTAAEDSLEMPAE
jgi:hypothetical protein